MADQELGGVAVAGTFTISMAIRMPKKIEKAVMSDGSSRWAFFKEYRVWRLNWPKLTKAELDVLIARYGPVDAVTTWKNTDERADVFNVVITDFSYDVIDPISATKYYKASMTLEESV